MKTKQTPGPYMLKGIGKVKGASGKPKLPRKKTPGTVSTSQYRNKGY